MTEVVTAPPEPVAAPDLPDRSGGLVFFGIVQIGIGLLCALLVLAIAAATAMLPQGTTMATLAQSMFMYGFGAYYFITVGIGSIRKRRWARDLSTVTSAIWLIIGVISAAVMSFTVQRVLVLVPPSQESAILAMLAVLVGIFFIALPLVLLLFYKSAATRATCLRHDERVRWTERAPLPVLALVLVLAFGSVSLLMNLGNPTLPFMGQIISGGPAALIILAFAGLSAFLAVQLYRLKESAWWALLILQFAGGIFAAVTFARMDINALYAAKGMLTPQVQAMKLQEIYRSPAIWAVAIASWLAYVGFVLYLRRFFTGVTPRTRATDAGGIRY